MPKIIYVPQGRSARLAGKSSEVGISGLYTNEFTVCNIVACIGKNGIALSHIDQSTDPKKFAEEAKWAGEDSRLFILYRTEGESLSRSIKELYTSMLPGHTIVDHKMDEKMDGVYISYIPQSSTGIHPNIKLFPIYENPPELVSHPQEREFLQVSKIQQIVGFRQRVLERKIHVDNQATIFDGISWVPIPSHELKLNLSSKMTDAEFKFFDKKDTNVELSGKMMGIMQDTSNKLAESTSAGFIVAKLTTEQMKESALGTVDFLESYLHRDDPEQAWNLFQHNMIDVLQYAEGEFGVSSTEEKSFKDELSNLIKDKKDKFIEITDLCERNKRVSSPFIKDVIDQCGTLARHYRSRKRYELELKEREAAREKIAKLTSDGVDSSNAGHLPEAKVHLLNALQLSIQHNLADNGVLAQALVNFGRICQKLRDYDNAEFFLSYGVSIDEKYRLFNSQKISKIKGWLGEVRGARSEAKEKEAPKTSTSTSPAKSASFSSSSTSETATPALSTGLRHTA